MRWQQAASLELFKPGFQIPDKLKSRSAKVHLVVQLQFRTASAIVS
jgi:hypothetical protein